MDEVISWLWAVSHWHWWAIGIALIALEVLAPTTYFLWPAAAAAVTGVIVWFIPDLDWRLQILAFAILSLVAVFAWSRWQKKQQPASANPDLNARADRYIGRRLTLDADLVNGRGRVRVDDGWWQVASEDGDAIAAGTTVEVISHDGVTLIVRGY